MKCLAADLLHLWYLGGTLTEILKDNLGDKYCVFTACSMFLNILTALCNTPRTQSDMQIEEIIKRETYRANLQQLVMCRCVADSRKNLNN